jgi:calcineurin-like phosphoesterase
VREQRLIRPLNYPVLADAPGRGSWLFEAADGRRVLVINLLGRVHMDALDDPFAAVDRALDACPLGAACDAAIVDIHCEATSEKMAMGHFCDGRASLVVGTHTHVPTADAQILNGGTAYQTDAGACADYDSVIGNQKEEPLRRFTTRISQGRYQPASGPATVCGVYVETDDATGLARRVEPIRVGGRLSPAIPEV